MSRSTRTAVVILVALVTLGGGFIGGNWWAQRAATTEASNLAATPTAATPTSTSAHKILYWHDPMVPDQKFARPGKSPFMDMQLVPVYADDATAAGGVTVRSNVAQSLGIRLGKVATTRLQEPLHLVGNVALDEGRARFVQARVAGYVTRLFVHARLGQVARGQALMEITAPEWLEEEQQYLTLLASNTAEAIALRASARMRLQLLDIPAAEIARLERTRIVNSSITIAAPIDGVITELAVREGAAFANGATLVRLNGVATVWIDARVPEAQLGGIHTGAAMTAHASAWPGVSFGGRVAALLPEVDATSRTSTVRGDFANAAHQLSPGMFVSVDIEPAQTAAQLVVPSEAVITTGRRSVVILQRGDGSFSVAEVGIGAQRGNQTVITHGLQEGESIVVSGQFLIDSEASLQATLDRLVDSERLMETAR